MKKAFIAVLSLVILATGVAALFAQKGGDRHGHGGPGFGPGRGGAGFFLRGIDLTDDQKAKVKAIFDAKSEARKADFAAMKATREMIEAATANGAFDEAAVTAAAHEQADLMAKSIVERERTKSQIFAILTDEQKAKLAAQKAEFDKKREEFKARRQAPKAADAPTN